MNRTPLIRGLAGYLAGLRYPRLFGIAGFLLVADLLIPDLIPFVDEILLAVLTALLASLKNRRDAPSNPPPPG